MLVPHDAVGNGPGVVVFDGGFGRGRCRDSREVAGFVRFFDGIGNAGSSTRRRVLWFWSGGDGRRVRRSRIWRMLWRGCGCVYV